MDNLNFISDIIKFIVSFKKTAYYSLKKKEFYVNNFIVGYYTFYNKI